MNAIQGKRQHKKVLENMVPLPSQYSVGTTLEPNGRTDFVAINRLSQETICALIGVPRSMIINDLQLVPIYKEVMMFFVKL